MLVIRMQRTGRKGHAQFRVVVQDSRRTPTSGKLVASLGHYNPHTKTAVIDKEKAEKFITNGAQPSDRVARLLQKEGVKLPKWVTAAEVQKRETRHPEKLRRNRPPEAAAEVAEAPETPEEPAAPAEEAVATTEESAEEATPEVAVAEAEPEAEPAAEEPAEPKTEA